MGYTYTTVDGQRVNVAVANAFAELRAEFKRVFGLDLLVSSGTRTRAEQERLYDGWVRRLPGFNLAAMPGQSNHEESGPVGPRALDVRDSGSDPGVTRIGTKRSLWLRDNCGRFGFKHTGYGFNPQESWHIEFQGALSTEASPQPVDVVRLEQNFLNVARGERLAVDGVRGPATIAAYKRYQEFLRAYGYTGAIDGVWGAGTQAAHARYYAEWDAARNAAPKYARDSYAEYQAALNKFGYNLVVDNVWGPKSSNALADFQRRHGLVADRIVGPKTRAALGI